ncbi:MAG: HD domain-containing protein [Patescibacteria group bacterium]
MTMTESLKRAYAAARFLFEVGTLRRIPRMHTQVLGYPDLTDNIASHTYRMSMIGWLIAIEEKLDTGRVVKMCLLHDLGETRSGDHNWVHKRYVKVFEQEIIESQLGELPWTELKDLAEEYAARQTAEAKAAKDADLLDQMLLVKEHKHAGSREAARWLGGQDKLDRWLQPLHFDSSKKIGAAIFKMRPTSWWDKLYTNVNR